MQGHENRPVNIGNPVEYTVRELAEMVVELSGSRSEISYGPLPQDDPRRRCPDISRAREVLGWEPHPDHRRTEKDSRLVRSFIRTRNPLTRK